MDLEDIGRIDRATWRKYLFYLDLAVFAVFAISLVVLVRHTYAAGRFMDESATTLLNDTLWLVVADTAFLVGSLSWIVYRFFRNEYLVLTRRF